MKVIRFAALSVVVVVFVFNLEHFVVRDRLWKEPGLW